MSVCLPEIMAIPIQSDIAYERRPPRTHERLERVVSVCMPEIMAIPPSDIAPWSHDSTCDGKGWIWVQLKGLYLCTDRIITPVPPGIACGAGRHNSTCGRKCGIRGMLDIVAILTTRHKLRSRPQGLHLRLKRASSACRQDHRITRHSVCIGLCCTSW